MSSPAASPPSDAPASRPVASGVSGSNGASAAAPKAGWRSFFGLDLLDNRYPALHGIRVLAIISVVQLHVTWIFAGEHGIAIDRDEVVASLTVFFGMDLFFVLSGFLIGSILLRSIEVEGTQNLRRFYIRRVARTFPAYYLVLAVLAATQTLTRNQIHNLPYEFVYATNFLSLHRNDVVMSWGWSLALEEQFYLTVPLLFFALTKLRRDRSRIALLVGLWLLPLITRLVLLVAKSPWNDLDLYRALYFRTFTRYDTLVCGVLFAFVHRHYKKEIEAWLVHPLHRALLALPALACLWFLLNPWMFGEEHMQLVHVFQWGTVTSVMYFAMLLLLLHGGGKVKDWLSAPFFRRVATLGYGVYLVHIPLCDHLVVPFARALQNRHVPMLVIWPVSLTLLMLLSLGAGYVLHVFVEKPSLKLRERLAA